jgi:hypothetical protein
MELFTEHGHATTATAISFSKEIIQESANWMEIGLEGCQNVNHVHYSRIFSQMDRESIHVTSCVVMHVTE